MDQKIIKFTHETNLKYSDFFVSKSNKHVYDFLLSWPNWEKNLVNICGENFSGKSHLINIFIKKFKGIIFNADTFDNNLLSNLDIHQNIVLENLNNKINEKLRSTYSNLNSWQKVQVARHEDRPRANFYINKIFSNFTPLSGDRLFAEDKSIIGGLARLNDTPIVIMGHEKGDDTKSRIQHNFGMARPEGYRKAVRLMDLADKFNLPVITFIDTPGAYPGKGAEERG